MHHHGQRVSNAGAIIFAGLPLLLWAWAAPPLQAQNRNLVVPPRAAVQLQIQVQRAVIQRRARAGRLPAVTAAQATSILSRVGVGLVKDKNGDVVEVSFPPQASYSYLRYISGFKKIHTLDLSGCPSIYDAGLNYLRDVKSLKVLKLSQCRQITDGGVASLAGLTELTHLDLSYCSNISDAGVEKLKGLTKLKELHLNYCSRLSENSLGHLAGMKHLEVLKLGHCRQIRARGWKHLQALSKLRDLDLSYTSVSDADLKTVATLPALKSLSLYYCRFVTPAGLQNLIDGKARLENLSLAYSRTIQDKDLPLLLKIPSLQTLNLRSTAITDAGIVHVAKLPRLKSLDLSYVNLNDAGLASLSQSKTLQELKFYNGKFTDRGLLNLAKMPALKQLDVSRCQTITPAGMKVFGGMKNLESLSLRYTSANDAVLDGLKNHKKLKELDLSGCSSLTAAALKSVGQIKSLESLNFTGSNWMTSAGLESLKGLTRLKSLNLSSCTRLKPQGVRHIADIKSLESLRLTYCRMLDFRAISPLENLKKLKELDVNGIRMSSLQLSKLRRAMPLAKVTGQATFTSSYRAPTYSYVSAKVLVLGELDNVQKKQILQKLKALVENDSLTFYSVADKDNGTEFELAPVKEVKDFREFAKKIKLGKTKVDEGNRTITVTLQKKPVASPKTPTEKQSVD